MPKKVNGRAKGAAAERELAAILKNLLGENLDIKRNLEQTRGGGYDLTGIDGWAPEVKRYAKATPSLKAEWWEQAVMQANDSGRRPVLFYRENFGYWTAVMRLGDITTALPHDNSIVWTVELSLVAWAYVARELM